jgi:DNA repair exonuclease SbcCD ATPase subunit
MNLSELKDKSSKVFYEIEANKKILDRTRKELEDTTNQMRLLELAGNTLKTLGETQRQKTTETFERVVTLALKEVFDSNYQFKIEVTSDKRVSTKFKLIDGENELDLMSAVGGGIVNVVALVLKVLILASVRPKRSQLLFLDESLNNVSVDYRPRVAKLLKSFSEQLGIQILLVTHAPEFSEVADVVYELSKTPEGTIATRIS